MADNPQGPFKLGRLARVSEQITSILDQAAESKNYREVAEALGRIHDKLQTMPLEWGDPLYHTKLPGGVVCHAMEPPFNVHYFLHQESRAVCILDIELLAGH